MNVFGSVHSVIKTRHHEGAVRVVNDEEFGLWNSIHLSLLLSIEMVSSGVLDDWRFVISFNESTPSSK